MFIRLVPGNIVDVDRLFLRLSFWYRKGEIVSNFGLLLLGTLLSRLFLALSLIVLARQMGPEHYGAFATSYSLAWLMSPLFAWGLDNWLIGPGAREPFSPTFVVNLSTCLLIKVVGGAVWVIILVGTVWFLKFPALPVEVMTPVVAAVWADEIQRSVFAVFKAILENRTNFLLMTTSQGAVFLGIGLLALKGVEDFTLYLNIWLAISVSSALFAFGILHRRFGFTPQLKRVCPILKQSFPFGLSAGLAMIYGRIDIAIVAIVLGPIATGLYSPAVSLINALALVPTTAYFVLLPAFRQTLSRGVVAFRRAIFTSLGVGWVGGALLGTGIWGMAVPLIRLLYGSAYESTGHILAILSGVLFARTINLILAAGIVVLDYQYQRVVIQIIAAIFNVVFNFLVIERWGILGVAWVFVATEWLLVAAYLWLFHLAFQRSCSIGIQPT